MKIKAISIWLPWAVLFPLKQFETRSWTTDYRGPLLVCASKGGPRPKEVWDLMDRWQHQLPERRLLSILRSFDVLPFGKAVGFLPRLTAIVPTSRVRSIVSDFELAVGDFSNNRFAWDFGNYRPIDPFPVKGKQGLFDVEVPDSLLK